MTIRIADGVFFSTPRELTRGRHELSRQEVSAVHRERLMIAATELLATVGYRGVGVREICAHAGVSRAAFYTCYNDKDGCIFGAYDRFISVLFDRLTALPATRPDGSVGVADFIRAYLTALQSDLVSARAFTVELDSLGRAGREQRRLAILRLAALIRDKQQPADSPPTTAPLTVQVGAVYALRQLTSDALDESTDPDLLGLVPVFVDWADRILVD